MYDLIATVGELKEALKNIPDHTPPLGDDPTLNWSPVYHRGSDEIPFMVFYLNPRRILAVEKGDEARKNPF